uniref:Vesicular inhibitory amino acid transporter n=1 Tax=Cynoglossus semilaevis TaxID=244447 RepID=A0A3P8UW29_CYNSE
MLVLTHSDELNRTYGGENGGPPVTEPDSTSERQGPVSDMTGCSSWSTGFKETRSTLVCTGARTITLTSAVSTTDWVKSTTSRLEEMKYSDVHLQKMSGGTEEQSGFDQSRGNRDRRENTEGQEPSDGTVHFSESRGDGGKGGTISVDPSLRPTITAWEAGWNVTNAIQGIFVLGLPFALLQSGYMGLVLLVLSAWVCNYTGRILVTCLYEEEPSGMSKVRVRQSYQDIVEACCKGFWSSWSGVAGCVVNVAQVMELLMTCTLYLVVSTSLMSDCLSGTAVPRSVCSLVSLLFLLPCLLLTDLRPVSVLSLFCSLAHILISLMVMLYCLSRSSTWSWFTLSLSVDPEKFLVSVGVIIFSYTSQIFLAPLEGSMEDRGQFNAMLAWTHGAACVMKTMFSLLAVLTWGPETSEVITDNLPFDLRPLVNLCLLAKALLSYPLPFYSAAEILQSWLLTDPAALRYSKHRSGGVSCSALLVRGALLTTSLLVPRFSLLMGLTGSVTGSAMTLILPCLFHLRLHWGRLTLRDRLIDVGILSLGVVCSLSGVICSVKRLFNLGVET